MRFQNVNGTEIQRFPNPTNGLFGANCASQYRTFFGVTFPNCNWYVISVTNNIIANNVAGLDGGGASLQDSLVVNFVNNTVASNDSTASAGILFNTLFAPLGSSSGTSCVQPNGTQSCPQVAGLVSARNSSALTSGLAGTTITCPAGHGPGGTGTGQLTNGACRRFSYPLMYNDVFWQNRSFFIGVGAFGTGQQNQQKVVTLFDAFTQTPACNPITHVGCQPQADATTGNGGGVIISGGTGACTSFPTGSYWDIGVRGDTSPTNHTGSTNATPLAPTFSVITSGYNGAGTNNRNTNPDFVSQYCNGSRVPPELGTMGYVVNPGTNESNAPIPVFSLTPSATVDEGNNWINMRFGPLSLTHPVNGSLLGNYAPATGSSVINNGSANGVSNVTPPNTDFFGNTRTVPYDVGAVESH